MTKHLELTSASFFLLARRHQRMLDHLLDLGPIKLDFSSKKSALDCLFCPKGSDEHLANDHRTYVVVSHAALLRPSHISDTISSVLGDSIPVGKSLLIIEHVLKTTAIKTARVIARYFKTFIIVALYIIVRLN